MTGFDLKVLEYIRTKDIIGVRSGKNRTKFTGIWMVEVDGRIFARSYSLSERSWYITFIAEKEGSIRCGKLIAAVKGSKPRDLSSLTPLINSAYEKKYANRAHNKKWVDGLNQPERIAKTMEFIPA
ncbi:MAG: DUF2255 family protein [Chitinophagales bacterium]